MVNKYFFEKYSDKKIIFLTKNLYRTVSGDNKIIYCLEDYVEEVCSIIEQNDISSFEETISVLQNYVINGLIIVEMAERTYIISPYLDSRLSWFENNKNIIFSDSCRNCKIFEFKTLSEAFSESIYFWTSILSISNN